MSIHLIFFPVCLTLFSAAGVLWRARQQQNGVGHHLDARPFIHSGVSAASPRMASSRARIASPGESRAGISTP